MLNCYTLFTFYFLPHLHLAPPLGVIPSEFRRDLLRPKTTVIRCPKHKLVLSVSVRVCVGVYVCVCVLSSQRPTVPRR